LCREMGYGLEEKKKRQKNRGVCGKRGKKGRFNTTMADLKKGRGGTILVFESPGRGRE